MIRLMLRAFTAGGALLLLAGCINFGETYPQFKAQTAAVRGVAITSDVMVLEETGSPLPLVDVARDVKMAEALNRYFRDELEKRGYKVESSAVSSVGLRYGAAVTPAILVRKSSDAPQAPLAELGKASAPYYIAPAYSEEGRWRLLQTAFDDMLRVPERVKAGPNPVSKAVRELGPEGTATHRLFILVEGVQVPLSRGLKQALTTGLLTLGTMSTFEMTTVQCRVGLADAATGEFILILNCSLAGRWTVDEAYLQRQAQMFFGRLDQIRAATGAGGK